jgi:hypothetical protein
MWRPDVVMSDAPDLVEVHTLKVVKLQSHRDREVAALGTPTFKNTKETKDL